MLNSNIWWPSDCEKWLKGKSKLKSIFFRPIIHTVRRETMATQRSKIRLRWFQKIRYSAKRVSEAFLFLSVRGDVGGHFFSGYSVMTHVACESSSTWSFCFTNWKDNPSEWQSKTFCNLVLRNRYLECQRKKGNKQEKYTGEIYCPYKLRRTPRLLSFWMEVVWTS